MSHPENATLLRRHLRTIVGAAVGALAGGLYAHFIGCHTGTCAITSNVWSAALFFGFTGAVALMPAKRGDEPTPPPARDPARSS